MQWKHQTKTKLRPKDSNQKQLDKKGNIVYCTTPILLFYGWYMVYGI